MTLTADTALDATFVTEHFAALEAEGYRLALPTEKTEAGAVPQLPTAALKTALFVITPLLATATKATVITFPLVAPDGAEFVLTLDIEADCIVRISEDADL